MADPHKRFGPRPPARDELTERSQLLVRSGLQRRPLTQLKHLTRDQLPPVGPDEVGHQSVLGASISLVRYENSQPGAERIDAAVPLDQVNVRPRRLSGGCGCPGVLLRTVLTALGFR